MLANFYTALNLYYLFTNYTYHKYIRVPDAFAYHVNFLFNKEIVNFSDICYKTPYQRDVYDEDNNLKLELPRGIKRHANGIEYDENE